MTVFADLRSWAVIDRPYSLPCFGEKAQQVRGDKRRFSEFFCSKIAGQTMKVDRKTKPINERSEVDLSQDPCDQSSENIACASGSHSGVAGRIDIQSAVGRGDHGAIALQYN